MALIAPDRGRGAAGPAPDDGRPILIGFANALAAPECVWSLRGAGAGIVAFAARGSRPSLRHCRDVRIVEITSPADDASAACGDLAQLLHSGEFSGFMPLDDRAVWLSGRLPSPPPVPVIGPVGPHAELALDKQRQCAAGLSVPPTRFVQGVEDLRALDRLPVIVKCSAAATERAGRLVRPKNHVCHRTADLEALRRSWDPPAPYLVQPLIAGTGEGVFGIATGSGIHAVSAHQRIRMMHPRGSGSSACMSIPVDPDLAAAAEAMLTAVGWRGMFMLEFLRAADGTAWFMELNGRPWGSMALARRGGLEYPAWAWLELVEDGFQVPDPPYAGALVCRHLGRELVHLLIVARGARGSARAGWPSRWRTVRELLRRHPNERWYNVAPGDRRLFVHDTVRTVLDEVRRALR